MKKWFLLLCVVVGLATTVPTLAQNDPCSSYYFYVDDEMGWCVLPDWSLWTANQGDQALTDMLSNVYSGVGIDDLGSFGDAYRVAVQVHEPVSNTILIAQVFQSDYAQGYDSPESYIQDSWISDNQGNKNYYQLDNAFGVPIGDVTIDDGQYAREFVIYPMPDLQREYTIYFFGRSEAWNDQNLKAELDLIKYSLYDVSLYQTPQTTEEAATTQNGQSNHPVWVGGDVLSVSSENGNGDSETPFVGAVWDFTSDGTVTFTPPGIGVTIRSDLFPLAGTYSTNGSSVTFQNGQYDISGGTLSFIMEYQLLDNKASVLIDGSLDVDSGVAEIHYLIQSTHIGTMDGSVSRTDKYEVSFRQQLKRA